MTPWVEAVRLLAVRTLTFASYVAYLDDLCGTGLLVRPLPSVDLPDPMGGPTLHAVGWGAVLAELDRHGFDLSEGDEVGEPCLVGCTLDGREVVGLFGQDPLVALPSLREEAEALAGLAQVAGVVLGSGVLTT